MSNSKLSDVKIRSAKLPDGKKKVRLSAGEGVYLEVRPSGKYWVYPYTYDGKRKDASLGVYAPGKEKHVSLKQAKSKAHEKRELLKAGIDPNQHQREKRQANIEAVRAKRAQREEYRNTFETVARQWHASHLSRWTAKHGKTILTRLEANVFPFIGDVPVARLTKGQVADVIEGMGNRGVIEVARRVSQTIRQVLNYASTKGLIDAVPMCDVKLLLPERAVVHMPAVTRDDKRLGELLRAIHGYSGTFTVVQALKLLPYLCVRSGEFRAAEWREFDLDAAIWTIPAAHRKLKKSEKVNPENVHLVPLSWQAVALLRELQAFTGKGRHVFPSVRGDDRPMSENTINTALSAIGFKGEMVGHGWRSVFSTYLNRQLFNADTIEIQLAHREKDKVRDAYRRADEPDYLLPERVKMMQAWADYLDARRDGADVIPIHGRA